MGLDFVSASAETPVDGPGERLRRASAAAHAATEQVPLLAVLATGEVSDAQYARVMGAFAAVFEAIVSRIQSLPEGPPLLALTDLAARARQARADARSLGEEDASPRLRAPFIRGPGSALGAIYTLEGSRHGGTVIGARLRRAGRPMGTAGYGFFDFRGVPVAEDWRAFRINLDRLLPTDDDLDAAVSGARGAFDLIAAVFKDA